MHSIILDTNFLLSSLKFKIDFISEIDRICKFNYEVLVFEGTLREIKNKKLGRLALEIIRQKNIRVINSKNSYVDKDILNLSGEDYIIATNDKNLIKKLKFPIIRIKQKKYLIIQKNVL